MPSSKRIGSPTGNSTLRRFGGIAPDGPKRTWSTSGRDTVLTDNTTEDNILSNREVVKKC